MRIVIVSSPKFPIPAVKGGAVAEVKIENGKLKFVQIMADDKDVTDNYLIFFRGEQI